jgi:hypothetical protein
MGKLRGILINPTLRSTIEEILSLPQAAHAEDKPSHDDSITGTDTTTTTDAPSSTHAESTPAASLSRVKKSKQSLSSPSFSIDQAKSSLRATCNNYDIGDATAVIPLDQISACQFLIAQSSNQEAAKQLSISLEKSIQPTTLIYERPNSINLQQQEGDNTSFQKRLQYLRQLQEERSYLASTSNIQKLNAHSTRDDVNVKSMMYATSVGLNMIVAPLSFGVFMYFFAGSLFSKFFPLEENNNHPSNVDIRQVIAGVLSGVILLFIEMILFVIRSHELDASVRKKERRREYKSNPFGYTSRAMERTYRGEMD